jgi:hypothetical protein
MEVHEERAAASQRGRVVARAKAARAPVHLEIANGAHLGGPAAGERRGVALLHAEALRAGERCLAASRLTREDQLDLGGQRVTVSNDGLAAGQPDLDARR